MYFFYFHDVYVDLPTAALRKFLYRKLMISNCKLYRTNKRISTFPVVGAKNYGRKIQ